MGAGPGGAGIELDGLIKVGHRGLGQKNRDAELSDYDEALKFNPSNTSALNSRAAVYNSKGEYDRAIQDLDQAIKLKPDYSLAFSNRGDAYRGKGDKDHAVADYKQALALNPSEALKKKIQEALDAIASGAPAAAPSTGASTPTPPAPSEPAEASGSAGQGQVDFRGSAQDK
jgi:tetratricopeptide (TPR) repeat protein